MFYQVEITTPANTLQANAQITRLRIHPGMTRRVWIMFPDGPYGLAHMQIWHHGWQVWPWSPGESYHWNDYVYTFEDRYPFTSEPYELVMHTWNLDDSYEHDVTFAMTLDPAPPPTELAELSELLEELGIME